MMPSESLNELQCTIKGLYIKGNHNSLSIMALNSCCNISIFWVSEFCDSNDYMKSMWFMGHSYEAWAHYSQHEIHNLPTADSIWFVINAGTVHAPTYTHAQASSGYDSLHPVHIWFTS